MSDSDSDNKGAAPTRWIVLDDTDDRITYTGVWNISTDEFADSYGAPNVYGLPHGGSQRSTRHGSLSFTFQGTAVNVYGTSHLVNTTDVLDPAWDCVVDGTEYPIAPGWPGTDPRNQIRLCRVESLADNTTHTLTISASAVLQDSTFWLDYIRYVPSSDFEFGNQGTVYIDSIDPSIQYSTNWFRSSSGEALMQSGIDSTGWFRFEFNGTQATWIGPRPVNSSAPETTYSIDDGERVPFQIETYNGPASLNSLQYQTILTTPRLPQGEHVLEVFYDASNGGSPLHVDHMFVYDSDPIYLGANSISTTAVTKTLNGEIVETLVVSPRVEVESSTPVGAIVGGTLGGAAFLAILGAIIFFMFRRKRRRVSDDTPAAGNVTLGGVGGGGSAAFDEEKAGRERAESPVDVKASLDDAASTVSPSAPADASRRPASPLSTLPP